MQNSHPMRLTLVIFSILTAGAARAETTKWESLYEKDGVQVSRSQIPGSPLLAFRGEGDIDAPLPKVLAVMRDISRAREWVDQVVEIKHVRQVNPTERVEYYQISLPWPFQNRDFVYQTRVEVDTEAQTITFSASSVEDQLAPVISGLVRGLVHSTRLVLKPIDGGKRTHAIGEAHTDPRGALPAWLVNTVQKKWPYNTFMNVRRQVAKPDIAEDPVALEFMAKLAAPAPQSSPMPLASPAPMTAPAAEASPAAPARKTGN